MITPTDEQLALLDAFRSGDDVVVEAYAGAGKTSSLRLLGQDCYPERHGTFVAFNRAVADEAKLTFPTNVMCSTAHSVAYRQVGYLYDGRLRGGRVTAKDLAERLGIKRWFPVRERGRKDISSWRIASLAAETVRKYCHSDDAEIIDRHVPWVQGVPNMDELRAVVVPYAQQIWADLVWDDQDCAQDYSRGWARFEHDHYMKLWALGEPVLYGDFVMVDESQDTNGVLAGVLRRQDQLQRVLVGDSRQRLFDWRGSVDVMAEFSEDATVCWLTQSFRFGDAVAEEANRWLSYLGVERPLRGTESIDSALGPVELPDAILCRTNADVIGQAMAAQENGVSVGVVGGVEQITSLAEAVQQLQKGDRTSHPELSVFKTWQDVMTYVQDERPGGTFGTMMRLIERYGVRRVLQVAAGCVPEHQADRVVATVHKVKGLEWDRVAVDGAVAPGNDGDPSDSDYMVAYVAVTRAKQELDTTAIQYFHRARELSRARAR